MTFRPVHWEEGMFLRPHHLQAAQRHTWQQVLTGAGWDVRYNWGLHAIQLHEEGLANYRLLVNKLQARLKDGSLVCVPEDGSLDPLDLKPALSSQPEVTVYLGLPVYQPKGANVGDGSAEGARFRVLEEELEDENTGADPQPLRLRQPNLRLLVSTQALAGYEVLPVARIRRSDRPDASPQVDTAYIPPILGTHAWKPLRTEILDVIYDRIGRKSDLLAGLILGGRATPGSPTPGDALRLGQLQELNKAYTLFGILNAAEGVHPLTAYLELCRLVGQLAIYADSRRPPALPQYDHDDLGRCFYTVKRHLDELLDKIEEPTWVKRPFVGVAQRLEVEKQLLREWLEPGWQMFIGAQSTLAAQRCVELLSQRGKLDMKIGSADRVDDIFRYGSSGLHFVHVPTPPGALRALTGVVFFQVDRQSQQEEWQSVLRSLTLAIRLNAEHFEGNIQGQQTLRLRFDGKPETLQLTLYVLKADRG